MKRMDSSPLQHGAKKTWHNRYVWAGFLRKRGSLYGVRLVLEIEQAKKLRNDLRDCLKIAEKYNRNNIEIDGHFGHQSQQGFKLEVRVYRPREED